jgi:hypothetical protein
LASEITNRQLFVRWVVFSFADQLEYEHRLRVQLRAFVLVKGAFNLVSAHPALMWHAAVDERNTLTFKLVTRHRHRRSATKTSEQSRISPNLVWHGALRQMATGAGNML